MIKLICGPMFSGKTSELLRNLERAHIGKKRVVLLRPMIDSRPFLSHSEKDTSWLKSMFLKTLDIDCSDYDTIGIDEGQMHSNLVSFCRENSLKNKQIIISALHATSECEMFDEIVKVIPYCEEIVKLNAVCKVCGSDFANYTKYLGGSKTEKVAVGGSETYTAVCEKCY